MGWIVVLLLIVSVTSAKLMQRDLLTLSCKVLLYRASEVCLGPVSSISYGSVFLQCIE